jgi:hypothetical protein
MMAEALTPMLDVASLHLLAPSAAPPGTLLIHAAKSPLHAAWLTIGGGGPRNILTIDNGEHGFKVVDGRRANGSFLQILSPRFVVDPESAITGTDSSPDRGTLFISSAGPGILSKLDYGECRVLLDGTILLDSSYENFAGFRHWRIEVDGEGHKPRVLFTYRHGSFPEKQ